MPPSPPNFARAGVRRALLLAVLAVPSGCADPTAGTAAAGEAAPPLRVEAGAVSSRLVLTGELDAEEGAVAVAPNVRVWPLQIRWVAEDGAEVAAGDRLVEFDNSQLASNLDELRSQVEEARNRVEQTASRAESEVADAALAREKALAALDKARLAADLPDDLVSAQELAERRRDLEAAELELAEADARLEARREGGRAGVAGAELELAEAETELARSEDALDRLVLTAPRAGIVALAQNLWEPRPIRAGDQVWPGLVVARIPDLTTLVVRAWLYDVDDGRIRPGMPVTASLDAFAERTFRGVVRSVDEIAQPVAPGSPRRAFRVVADLDSLDPGVMRPGMSVKLEVEAQPVAADRTVPRRAIAWEGESPRVELPDGTQVAVELGPCSPTTCVLLEGPEAGTLLARPEAGEGP